MKRLVSALSICLMLAVCATSVAASPESDLTSGQRLNAYGQYAQATELLEAALLRSPDDLRIQLEYAIALAGSGSVITAQHLLLQLSNEAKLDSETRRQINYLIQKNKIRAYVSKLPKGSASIVVGHDDNLLSASNQGAFELTLPGGNLGVTPSADQLPKAGFFTRIGIQFDGTLQGDLFQIPAQPVHYGLFISQTHAADRLANRTHWGLLLEINHSLFPGSYIKTSHQQMRAHAASAYRQFLLAGGLTMGSTVWGHRCQTRLGADVQTRSYEQTKQLNGIYTGLQTHTSCQNTGLQLTTRLGIDEATQVSRPGGNQLQTAIKLAYNKQLLTGSLRAQAEWSWQQDADGYSPLLNNNRARRLQRTTYRVEYRGQVNNSLFDWQPYASVELQQQIANIPLFSLRKRVITFGLVADW